jgi:hypothetical protein
VAAAENTALSAAWFLERIGSSGAFPGLEAETHWRSAILFPRLAAPALAGEFDRGNLSMTISKTGASALALIAAFAFNATPALASEANQPSAFIQCDGRTGHVSGGESFMRLLLVTATAGISEAGMSKDDASKRVKGSAGSAACDQAIGSEGDAYRRIQLGFAKSLHFAEDKKWDEAAAAARAAPSLTTKADWGLDKSSTGTARYLEALFLIRAGKVEQGEVVAWDGVQKAGLDVITLQRMGRFIGLSRTMTPEKRASLEKMRRYYPDSSMRVSSAFADAGDYAAAADSIRGVEASVDAFLKEPVLASGAHSLLAAYAAMRGDVPTATAQLKIAKTALDKDRSEGDAASEPSSFAAREDAVAFAEAAIAQASGNHAEAAKLLAARGSWPAIPAGLVARLVGKVAPQVPEKDRMGVVAKGEDALWKEALEARLAVLRNADKDAGLWSLTGMFAQDVNYQRLAGQALTGMTAKPKWLVKAKEPRNFDVIATGVNAQGWEAGEGVLYHAALIAQQRGKQGFVIVPKRSLIDIITVRFVNPGELGIPSGSIVMASDVIAALSPHIQQVR